MVKFLQLTCAARAPLFATSARSGIRNDRVAPLYTSNDTPQRNGGRRVLCAHINHSWSDGWGMFRRVAVTLGWVYGPRCGLKEQSMWSLSASCHRPLRGELREVDHVTAAGRSIHTSTSHPSPDPERTLDGLPKFPSPTNKGAASYLAPDQASKGYETDHELVSPCVVAFVLGNVQSFGNIGSEADAKRDWRNPHKLLGMGVTITRSLTYGILIRHWCP